MIDEKEDVRKKFKKTLRPGIYQVFRTPDQVPPSAQAEASEKKFVLSSTAQAIGNFAVNIDPKESNPEKIDDKAIQKLLPGMRVSIKTEANRSSESENVTEMSLGTPVLLLMALALFYEGWLVRRE